MSGELRYSIRTLLRTPRFTLVAVLVLGLGLGATTAMFSVVESVLLRPLPYSRPERLAVILSAGTDEANGSGPLTPGDFDDFRKQNHSFEDIAAASLWGPTLTGIDRAEKLDGLRASASLFRILGVHAAYGRLFEPADGGAEAAKVAVLTDDLFRRQFGGNPSILGQTIRLDGTPYIVIGVTPPGFFFPPFWADKAGLFVPDVFRVRGEGRGPGYLRLFGRLKSGVTLEQARAEIRTIANRLARDYPRTNAGLTAAVTSLPEASTGALRPLLLVLFGAVSCLLLIACANIANLLIARASDRRREFAVRQSLGATRAHLIRQFLAETGMLVAAGGIAGLLLARWCVPLFVATIPGVGGFRLLRVHDIGLDRSVYMFHVLLCALTTCFCGIIAATHRGSTDLNAELKESGRGDVTGRNRNRVRFVLATAEIAIALVLLAGAGLLVESYRKLSNIDPGFDPNGVIAVNLGLAASEHRDADRRAEFYQQALAELRGLPGVTAASAVNHVPFAGDRFGMLVTLEGRPAPDPGQTPRAVWRVAMPGYFGTMRMRLVEGRDFNDRDTENAPAVAIVNATAARTWWPGESPIGKRIHRGDAQTASPWATVTGVIADVKQADWQAPADAEVYFPFQQDPDYRHDPAPHFAMTMVLRASNAASLAPAIRARIGSIDRNVAVPDIFVMDRVVRDITWQPRTSMALILFFACVAVLLAAIGIYAVMSFMVAGRTREIGVRMALGARRADVLGMVLRQSLGPIAGGLAIGLTAAAALTRLMTSLLYGVTPTDPAVFGAVVAGLAAVAIAASLIPARRAATVDPLVALRQE